LGSAAHCSDIYNAAFNYVGVGNTLNYWAQNFIGSTSVYTNNVLYDGSHYQDATFTGGKVRFFATYYSPSAVSPTAISVVIGGTSYPLSLQLGYSWRGTYFVDLTAGTQVPTTGCTSYYFTATASGVTNRLPENGYYNTVVVSSTCTINWSLSPQSASGGGCK